MSTNGTTVGHESEKALKNEQYIYLDTVEVTDSSSVGPTINPRKTQQIAGVELPANGSSSGQTQSQNSLQGHSDPQETGILIPLTQGFNALIDRGDLTLVSGFKWWVRRTDCGGAYAVTKIEGRIVYLHRLLCGFPSGGLEVDHRNRNGLDCRRDNLRLCSHLENSRNRRLRRAATKKFKGVWREREGKFRARITIHRQKVSLGCFATEVEAAIAYDRAASKYFGEFACLNLPDQSPSRSLIETPTGE